MLFIWFLVISSALAYLYIKYLYSYWQRRGVEYLQPSFPFGNAGKNFMQKMCLGEQLDEFYRSATGPFIGVYGLFRPNLVACCPEFIRNVLIRDFATFIDRGVYVDEKNDPLSGHLFSLPGEKWKSLRAKLTPTFTSGKMKSIFQTLLDCIGPLQNHMKKLADSDATIEAREMSAKFTTNVIASAQFGLDVDTFADPESPFRRFGRRIFELNWKNGFRLFAFAVCPSLLKWTGMRTLDPDVEDFFYQMVTQNLELREKNNIVRKDFFQLLVQLRNTGSVQLDDEWKTVIKTDSSKTLTIDELTAQALIFYVAGFETSSATMSYCLFEIAKNPDIQRKLHQEIDAVLAKHDGKLTYESINDLKYLECCLDETLRKYPPVPFLFRESVKDYKVPGSHVTIEKGTPILIPVFSLHRDEKYYPDPLKFDPTRFFPENRKSFVEMPYLAFGEGPRNCIGLRMGKMTTKVGIASMLQKFSVELGDEHIGKEIKFCPAANLLTPISGINLKINHRYT